VFSNDAKVIQRMAPLLRRVLIVDPQPASANLIAEHMRTVCRPEVTVAASNAKGLRAAGKISPNVIFVELAGDKVDALTFTRMLRRSDLPCRKAPVILTTASPSPSAILAARDAGVHEFLSKPFLVKDLLKRLEAVAMHPRDWVEAVDYIGPDRRRFNSGDYAGPLRRHADSAETPEQARIGQALNILKSALNAVEGNRAQALRALAAQTVELEEAAKALSDEKLLAATTSFHHYLFHAANSNQPLHRADVERRAVPLLAYLPTDEDPRRVQRI